MMNYDKIIFLGKIIPDELLSFFENNTKSMQDAANVLQMNILDGFCKNIGKKIELINVLPIDSFPKNCNKAYVPFVEFDNCFLKSGINISFCNINGIKNLSLPHSLMKNLKNTIVPNEHTLIIIYTLSSLFLSTMQKLKKKNYNIDVCCIVADLPKFSSLSSNKKIYQRVIEKHYEKKSMLNIKCIDFFVLLTKAMADFLKIDKPYVVIEGIASEKDIECDSIVNENRYILYSGTLHKKFGIIDLLESFIRIKSKTNLLVCGSGDSEEEIKKYCKLDDRIKFLGKLSHVDVLRLQKKATLLVNPRKNNDEFTKYSFPSKTMEYLKSGRPVVCYKLDGIPNEYDDFLIYPNDDSIEAMSYLLDSLLLRDEEELTSIGIRGMNFVKEKKNSFVQIKKIIDLIKNNSKGEI